jgi:cysteine desulfurase
LIYLDYNSTTPMHSRVLEVMLPYMTKHWANPSSAHRFGNEARRAVETSRERIADCLGCEPGEIVFCGSGTEAANLAIRGVCQAQQNTQGHIITSSIEHPAVINTCLSLKEQGFSVDLIPVNKDGVVDIRTFSQFINHQTRVVSVMHANNETGTIQPVEEIAEIARMHQILFHIDAVQSVGKIPVRVCDLGADLVSFSGHKIYGPKGIGVLYIRKGTPFAPLITGGHQEQGFRPGTENVAAIVGVAEALEMAVGSLSQESARLTHLRDQMEAALVSTIPGVRIHAKAGPRVPNTSSICFNGIDGESVALALDCHGFSVSTGSACASNDSLPSHVLLAMGLTPQAAQSTIRVSLGHDTQKDHIEDFQSALLDIVRKLRIISSL